MLFVGHTPAAMVHITLVVVFTCDCILVVSTHLAVILWRTTLHWGAESPKPTYPGTELDSCGVPKDHICLLFHACKASAFVLSYFESLCLSFFLSLFCLLPSGCCYFSLLGRPLTIIRPLGFLCM